MTVVNAFSCVVFRCTKSAPIQIGAEMIVNEKDPKCLIWVANYFADKTLQREKFLVRFKLPETAKKFLQAFKKAIKAAQKLEQKQAANNN